MSKGVQIAVGATGVALLLGWYGMSALGSAGSYRYYQTLDEFRAAQGPAGAARIHGYVAVGSIARDVEAKSVRFAPQNRPPHAGTPDPKEAAGPGLAVRYASLETPDLFKDGAEVVIEGELRRNGSEAVFHATKVLAKCPSKFEAAKAEGSSS